MAAANVNPRARGAGAFVLALVLLTAGLFAWGALTPPRPLAPDADPALFSAVRAMADVEVVAAEPHPVGSTANRQVRQYLFGRMAELGLQPRVQAAEATDRTGSAIAVNNLVGVLEGRDSTIPALALMAHYDSTDRGPGAGDDAAGVAAVLEIIRALKARNLLWRDVIVVLTDGEEAGLLGARAFFQTDPAAQRIGFVINLEARGSRGRAMMFETGRRNGETIRLFAKGAPRPLSNSMMVFVYEKMPNGTDFTIAKDRGLQGLNFAFLGGAKDYHTASDTPANLDRRSLQDLGAQALAATWRFATGHLPEAAPDVAYSDVLGLGILAYPPMAGWGVLAVSAILLAIGWRAAHRRGEARLKDGLLGLGLSMGFLVAGGLVLYGLHWTLVRTGAPRLELAAAIETVAIGLAALVAGAASRLGRRLGPSAWAGAIAGGLCAGLMAQVLAPVAAPVIHWPILAACLGAAVSGLAAPGLRPALGLAVIAAPGLAFIAVLAHQSYLALLTPLAILPWTWLALLLAWPLISRR